MTVLSQEQELFWGALVFDGPVEPDTPWRYETLVGTSFGNAVPIVEFLTSQLTDGDLAVVTRYGNREEFPVIIRVSAPDGQALSQAEAALMAEAQAEQISPLIWKPPALEAWPGALEIVTVRVERDYQLETGASWDYREKYSHTRVFRLTFTALPWVRDLESTVIPAIPVPVDPEEPAVVIPIDECDSATGWTTLLHPTGLWSDTTGPTAESGQVGMTSRLAGGSGEGSMSLVTPTYATVDMSATPYLIVDVQPTVDNLGEPVDITVLYDTTVIGGPGSVIFEPVARSSTAEPGVTRWYFEAPASFTKVRVRRSVPQTAGTRLRGLYVHHIARTDRIEVNGSNGFQIARTAIVGGSVPTQAAIRFSAAEVPLVGSTALIYTGSSPVVPLRAQRITSAVVTPDDTKISGAYNDLSDPMVFRIPVDQLRDSSYSVLARLEFTDTAVVTWEARIVANDGSDIPGSDVVLTSEILLRNDSADPWRIHPLAKIQLPVVAIQGSSTHAVELTLSMATGGEDVNVDEAWLADTRNGAVTLVHEPSAFQLSEIEIRSPQLDSPRPAVIGTWVGYGAQDISRLTRLGTHLFRPGLLHVFTATDLAKYAGLQLEYYRRHGWHAGPDMPTASEAA